MNKTETALWWAAGALDESLLAIDPDYMINIAVDFDPRSARLPPIALYSILLMGKSIDPSAPFCSLPLRLCRLFSAISLFFFPFMFHV